MTTIEQTKIEPSRPGFCIFITTGCEGSVPSVRNELGMPYVFKTQFDAECEIASCIMAKLKEFMADERDFEDAMTVEEYVISVDVYADGSVADENGNHFGLH